MKQKLRGKNRSRVLKVKEGDYCGHDESATVKRWIVRGIRPE